MRIPIALLVAAALRVVAQGPPQSTLAPDAEIRKILAERIDIQRQRIGFVVGVIEPRGRRIVTYGTLAKGDKRPLDGDTVFEIDSVTKVFTSLLLADMVERKQVALDDPVAKYLPQGVKVPQRGGRQITLESLSLQTSGLPSMPSNLTGADPANPYADYSVERLYQFLSGYTLTRDVGAEYEYSNLGVGLLGHVLARSTGMGYSTLVESRITAPLGMTNTRIEFSPEMRARLASRYDAALAPDPGWDIMVLSGAGGLRTTANDLLTFLAANLGYTKTPLAPAMAAMLKVRRPTGTPGQDAALGWLVSDPGIIWHNGGTGGYRSFVGFNPSTRAGVVVLSNAETDPGVDDIGRHLLDPGFPLLKTKLHTELEVIEPTLLDRCVGRYQFGPGSILSVAREGNRLWAQRTGQEKLQIYAESDRDYFYRVVDAQITFEDPGQGPTTALVLHQNGQDLRAKRVE